MKLRLENRDKALSGEWQEGAEEVIPLSGVLADTAIVFYNTNFNLADHYHQKPLALSFKD